MLNTLTLEEATNLLDACPLGILLLDASGRIRACNSAFARLTGVVSGKAISDPEELRQEGIEMISPHRQNRVKPKTQDGRRLRRYERRWLVERFFAWLQWQRRLLVRWEYYVENFLGFVQLATIGILLRQF